MSNTSALELYQETILQSKAALNLEKILGEMESKLVVTTISIWLEYLTEISKVYINLASLDLYKEALEDYLDIFYLLFKDISILETSFAFKREVRLRENPNRTQTWLYFRLLCLAIICKKTDLKKGLTIKHFAKVFQNPTINEVEKAYQNVLQGLTELESICYSGLIFVPKVFEGYFLEKVLSVRPDFLVESN